MYLGNLYRPHSDRALGIVVFFREIIPFDGLSSGSWNILIYPVCVNRDQGNVKMSQRVRIPMPPKQLRDAFARDIEANGKSKVWPQKKENKTET